MNLMLNCPICGHRVGGVTEVGDDGTGPAAGDCSICLYCAGLTTFTGEGYETRPCTPAELAEFGGSHEVRQAQAAVRSYRRFKASGWN